MSPPAWNLDPAALETLVHVLIERARLTPEQAAFVFLSDRGRKEERLSYAALLRRVRASAAFLHGVAQPGDRIVLLYPPGLEYVTAFLGCLYAGMVALPLFPPRRNQRLLRVEEVFRNASPKAALTSAALFESVAAFLGSAPGYAGVELYSTSALADELADGAGPPRARAGDLAFLQYTSGSTGAPKGVMVSHGNLMANSRAIASALAYETTHEAYVNWLPLYHDMGLIGNVLQPLYAGLRSVLMSPVSFIQSPLSWLEAIDRYRGTVAGAPNFAYDLCVEKVTPAALATLDLSHWRIAYTGSEPIRAATLRRFAEAFAPAGFRAEQLYPCYGMAESTLFVTGSDPRQPPVLQRLDRAAVGLDQATSPTPPDRALELVGCGRAVADHRVCIVDPVDLGALRDGQVGEIWIAGPSVTLGYWNNAEATRASFGAHTHDGDGPFLRSGDLGFLDRGELFVTGRIKELIIVRGRNHYPQDLEAVASACHPALRRNAAAAFGVELDGQEQVVLVQEVERGTKDTDWSEVFPLIRQAVADVHELALAAIVLIRINALPKTTSGKIQRGTARALFLAGELEAVAQWHGGEARATRPAESPAAPAPATAATAATATATLGESMAALRELAASLGDRRQDEVLAQLRALVAALVKKDPAAIDPTRPLLELGVDSLMLMSVLGDLERRFGVALEIREVLEDLPTLADVARRVAADLPTAAATPALAVATPEVAAAVARLMEQHMQVMTMALRLLGGQPPDGTPPPPDGRGGSPAGPADRSPASPADGPATARAITAVARARAMPMSFAQERMWFLHQLSPASPAYNLSAAIELTGALDPARLAACVHEVVRRHESLRTTFVAADDGTGVQRIAGPDEAVLPELAEVELAHLAAPDRAAALKALSRASARTPFVLDQGPLVRTKLVRLAKDAHVWLFDLHHIVADGWSMILFLREIATLYQAGVTGQPSPLRPLPVHYADYAHWQRQAQQGERFARELAYWTDALAGVPEALALPTDRPRPATQRGHGDRVTVRLPRELTDALRALGRRHNATLFMTVLAGFQALLARYSRQADVVVGTPTAGRTRPELRELIGLFVNTLPLRARVSERLSFGELLDQVRATVLQAFAHQEVPFERIVEALGVPRELGRAPVVQVLFALQNLPAAEVQVTGLVLRASEIATQTAKLDLALTLWEVDGGLTGSLEYDTALFDHATVERMARHLHALLAQVAAEPAARVQALVLGDEAERAELAAWNATEVEPREPGCLHEQIAAQAARTPAHVALIVEHQRLTYAELLGRANRLAHHLRALGVGPDVIVAVLLERSVELMVAVLGIMQAGGAYLPLDPEHPAERLAFALRDARAPVLLTCVALAGRVAAHDAHVRCLDTDWPSIAVEPAHAPRSGCAADHLAYVLYTSGSTGVPKGVENSHRGIVNRLRWHQGQFPLAPGDRVLHKTPYTFDVSVWELFWPLVAGATVVMARPGGHGDPRYLAELIATQAITAVHFVPSMLRAFVESLDDAGGGRRWPELGWVLCSGEALTPELVQLAAARLGPRTELHNLYGPTEAAIDVTHWPCRPEADATFVPIGRPVANTRIYLVDEALRPVPVGVPGELCIGGVQVARGYLGRAALTADRFAPDPFGAEPGARMYRTGDLARYRPGGVLEFLGRLDFQVKLRGVRLELGEVEAALRACPGVRQAVALVREDRPGDQRLVAYVVAQAEAAGMPSALRPALARRLPASMVPSDILMLPALPLTSSGKLDRAALPAPTPPLGATAHPIDHVAPRGAIEAAVASIWAEVLGLPRIGAFDHFFERGGHSLLATQVIARLRRELHVELALRVLFEAPTLAGFADRVSRALATRQPTAAEPELEALARPAGQAVELPASFAQERLWFLQQLEPDSPAYHMPAAVQLSGTLDQAALAAALRALVRRHEGLRTTFTAAADGRPMQRIAPPTIAADEGDEGDDAALLELLDLSGLRGPAQEAELARLARDHAARPFDLARGPLLRSCLVRLGATEHVWLVTLHHIISDDWSIGVMVRELSELYAARRARRAPRLPGLPLQYADYAHWQRQVLCGPRLDHELAYWTAALAGLPHALELPTDRPRPLTQSYRGGSVPVLIPGAVTQALEALARRDGATLFMVVLAGFQLLLSRYSRQPDLVVGAPVANRTRGELEGVLGCFINTLALRARLHGNPRFSDLLAQVRDTALDAYAHQLVPFERIVEALGVPRDLGRAPVVQVLFTLQNAPMPPLQLPGLVLRERELATDTAKLDLDLTLREVDGALAGALEFNADLFDRSTIECLVGHLATLLASIAATPDRRLADLAWLPDAERHLLVTARNQTARDFAAHHPAWHRDATFAELFDAQVRRTPAAVALQHDGHRLTYAELADRAHRVAHGLHAAALGREHVVALLADRGLDFIAAILGVLQAGAAYMPLDPDWPPARMQTVLAHSRAAALLAAPPYLARARDLDLAAPVLDLAALLAAPPQPQPVRVRGSAQDLAYVLFTSGSTGTPKGVMVPHAAMLNQQLAKLVELDLGSADTLAQTARQSFDISVWQMLAMLLVGGRVLILRDEHAWVPHLLLAELAAHRVALLETVPSHLALLLDELEHHPGRHDLTALRWLMPTGEALPPALCRRWFHLVPAVPLVNAYGPAECADDTSLCKLVRAPATAFTPIHGTVANVRYYVLDPDLALVPDGVPGELCIGGAGPGRGYIHDPARTAAAFVPDPFATEPGARLYRTGDLVRYRPDASLEFLGRLDFQVKLRGFRIELGEIEAALRACPQLRDAAVLVRHDPPTEPRLVAYLVPHPAPQADDQATDLDLDLGLDLAAVQRALEAALPPYMVPAAFVVLAELPRSANGKLERAALPAPAHPAASASPAAEPRTPSEQLLAGIWRELLGGGPMGRSDDFFARGGHSLLAIQVAARAGQVFGVHVPVRAIFEHPVLADLAVAIQRGETRWQPPPLAPVSRAQRLPLSFSQEQLWMAQMLAPDSGAYNMSAGLRLRGPVRLDVLAEALTELVRRHEILRMRVDVQDGRPALALDAALPVELREEDLRPIRDPAARAAELARRLDEQATEPFELGRARLFRLACVRLGDDEVVLALTLHHLTCDGWSINLLAGELAALYQAFAAGQPSPLPALALQYADIAAWQRAWMTGPVLDEHVEHFARKLGGDLPVLALPLDRPRAQRRGHAGAVLIQALEPELGQALAQLGQQLGATLNMTLMAGFLVLLHRFSRQEDLLLGTTVAGRSRPEMEPLIGCFINNLVLRFDLAQRPSFRELVAQVRRETLEAYDYQALPFEKLLDALNPRREPGVSPLFQVTFGVQPTATEALALPGIELEWLRPPSETARYDLTVWIEQTDARLTVEWTYSAELFDASTIAELATAYQDILRRAARDPELGLAALALDPRRSGDEPTRAAKKVALGDSLRRIKRKPSAVDEAG